jgi:hypothetical protein
MPQRPQTDDLFSAFRTTPLPDGVFDSGRNLKHVSDEFVKIHLCLPLVQPNTGVLLAKKGGETDEHGEISHISGFGRCGAWRFCLC